MITTQLLIIFGLLLLNAFFAMSEMAIVSSRKPLLRHMAKQGSIRAQIALDLAEDSGRFLSTVQVGITLVGILAGAYGGAEIADKLSPVFESWPLLEGRGELVAVVLVVSCITYLSVVIGELVPKQFALSKPEPIAMAVAPIMRLVSLLCTPLVIVLEYSARSLFWMLRLTPRDENVTEAEVKAVLAEGAASGVIEKTEHDMLQRIIRLGDRDVTSIMTHRVDVTFIDVNDTLETIRTKVLAVGHSRYPVIDGNDNECIGIVLMKDILAHTPDASGSFTIRPFLKEAPIIPEQTKCLDALETFKNSRVHLAIIVGEYGETLGIITPSDLLEGIVGVMPSNYGAAEEPLIAMREDGSWLVDGQTPIDEIHLVIGMEEIEAGRNYETIAGFIIDELGQTPKLGDVVQTTHHRLEIIDMDARRIDKILISKRADASS